ncbi:NAD(P)/FAD-dependent oxidoreductase [Nevskia sp.]|uniref:flavin-containing monooxygenase n=1 Tax=Nevskia sp. TaxID=1929292 RepID=UPI0025F40C91|nr:NAD(P)/FAD-dependent oxidoreductase [Nevskia sp.]
MTVQTTAAGATVAPDVTRLTAGDDALRHYCSAGEFPVLVMTAAHLSGDASLLKPEWTPTYQLATYASQLSEDQEAAGRAQCFEVLRKFRDSGKPVPGRPGYDFMQAVLVWICGKDAEPLQRLLNEQIVFGEDDPQRPAWTKAQLAPDRRFHVVIVGAGESGLLTAHRLKQAGVPFTIYEKNGDVGGTWLENSYPGCRVDINSFIYSYTFAQRIWPEYFGARDEVLAYLKDCASLLGLREHIRLNREVLATTWDEATAQWTIKLRGPNGEETAQANVVVSGVGQLNRPSWPNIEGRDSYAGQHFHSARWDASVNLEGKRVGVIGTGASATQFIPHVARVAAQLDIHVRTIPWLLPTPHLHAQTEDGLRWLMANLPNYIQWHRLFTFTPQLIGFLDTAIVDPSYPPTEIAISAANDAVRQALTGWAEFQIADRPELRPLLVPKVPPGSKRLPRDNGTWVATLKRNNVKAITTRIERITPKGIRTVDGVDHEYDVLIYGTGFKASEFLMPMQVIGRGGHDLHTVWNSDARAYLGATISGFPNLFCLYGPNTNLVLHGASIIYISECAANYVLEGVRLLLEKNLKAIDVKPEIYAQYNERIDEANGLRAWGYSKVSSWYKNAKGRVTQNWPFTGLELWRRTRQIEPQDYTLS